MTSSVIITIVVVLGIIVAGGFLLYFMGDLLMSLSNKGKDSEAVKNAQLKKQKELESRVKALENSQEKEGSTTILYNGAIVESYNPEEEENTEVATEEQSEEETAETEEVEETEEETVAEETEETEVAEETEEEEEEDDEASEYIRQRRAELMERLARMQAAEEEEEETEEDDSVDVSEEETEETTEEPSETEEVEEAEEETVETEEESADVVADSVFEEAKNSDEEGNNNLASTMTLEELETKLAEEQDKLKANEKELRQCKKEFLPLRRVKRTLENDEKKLRRKEALVAKQKVVLYGVNNYADIDEEKAKKLAEDLDLLDGLKLSVQHCEEVMEKNKERYPLLEKIFNLLSSQNAEIKDDVKKLQEAIEELKSSDTDSATDSTDAE